MAALHIEALLFPEELEFRWNSALALATPIGVAYNFVTWAGLCRPFVDNNTHRRGGIEHSLINAVPLTGDNVRRGNGFLAA